VRRIEEGIVELQLMASGAQRVELRGDFTDWRPVEMEDHGGGRWRLRQVISPGVHSVSVRYDGGPWVPPPVTRVVTDEFGEDTGVLVVE
jgi:1,4-alpha-glucan branching enzyme